MPPDIPTRWTRMYSGRVQGFTYAREGHPNADVLAAMIDALEGREGGLVTGLGHGGGDGGADGGLKAGDHVLGGDQLYGRSLRLMGGPAAPRHRDLAGRSHRYRRDRGRAAPRDPDDPGRGRVEPDAARGRYAGIARLARRPRHPAGVDNTFTTPRAFRPFEHGADIVIHSVTKLLAGHSDATLGYVAARDPALRARSTSFPSPWA
jgi:cystathionine beta-lyase/cystathionine gamma-synthase